MKWPSSSASAARNSARISSSVMASPQRRPMAPIRRSHQRLQPPLRAGEPTPIRPPISRARFHSGPSCNPIFGVRMKRIGWAIALAAAAMTCSGQLAAAGGDRRADGREKRRRTRRRAAPAIASSVAADARVSACPSRARIGIQEQVTEIGREAASFHNGSLLWLCALISLFVLGAARLHDGPLSPRRQSDAVADQPQHADRGHLDAGPGADPGGHRHPLDPPAAATNIRRRRPTSPSR